MVAGLAVQTHLGKEGCFMKVQGIPKGQINTNQLFCESCDDFFLCKSRKSEQSPICIDPMYSLHVDYIYTTQCACCCMFIKAKEAKQKIHLEKV